MTEETVIDCDNNIKGILVFFEYYDTTYVVSHSIEEDLS